MSRPRYQWELDAARERRDRMIDAALMLVALACLLMFIRGAVGCIGQRQIKEGIVMAGYEAALDACVVNSRTYIEYERCAGEVDERYGLYEVKDGGPK